MSEAEGEVVEEAAGAGFIAEGVDEGGELERVAGSGGGVAEASGGEVGAFIVDGEEFEAGLIGAEALGADGHLVAGGGGAEGGGEVVPIAGAGAGNGAGEIGLGWGLGREGAAGEEDEEREEGDERGREMEECGGHAGSWRARGKGKGVLGARNGGCADGRDGRGTRRLPMNS